MKRRQHIYLNEADIRVLNRIAKQKKESKSSVVRKLISVEKYTNTLKEIEIRNRLIGELVQELNHVGTNLNQIAYHLNADITNIKEAKNDLEKNMCKLQTQINDLKKEIKKLEIDIGVNHTKTPSEFLNKEENG